MNTGDVTGEKVDLSLDPKQNTKGVTIGDLHQGLGGEKPHLNPGLPPEVEDLRGDIVQKYFPDTVGLDQNQNLLPEVEHFRGDILQKYFPDTVGLNLNVKTIYHHQNTCQKYPEKEGGKVGPGQKIIVLLLPLQKIWKILK